MKRTLFQRIVLSVVAVVAALPLFAIRVVRAECEMAVNPVGIDVPSPRLGWQLASEVKGDKQTAYRIIVASSRTYAEQKRGDMWDSGQIDSGCSQRVPYEGSPLKGGTTYYWTVQVWDAQGKPSEWSDVAQWEQAPDFASLKAEWIGAIRRKDSGLPVGNRAFHAPSMKDSVVAQAWGGVADLAKRSILLRKPVDVNKMIKDAVVYISGLGHYELTINGKPVGDSRFAPLWSDYDKTVYYNIYSVKELLASGENVFGVMLGNGMYNVSGNRYRKLWVTFGPPTLYFQAQITYTDGSVETVRSDGSWKWTESPITFNCVFGGEDYDARLEQSGWDKPGFNDKSWSTAVVQAAPGGKLAPQLAPPVRIRETFGVNEVKRLPEGRLVFDMKQNLSGFPTLVVKGKAGQKVRLYVGELLHKDGSVNQTRSGKEHYYEYTLKGEGEEMWTPRFSYYGYQYIQVDGADYLNAEGDGKPVILSLTSNFIYNDVPIAGTFESSNDIFNKTHWLINNAIKSNMQAVFTDCPHREKLGWLEEVHLNGPGLYYNYDLTQLIPKVMQDMSDAQHANGLVPSIVPEYTDFGAMSWGADFQDSPEWGVAVCATPWQYYEYYGDSSLIERYYPAMQRYVDYLLTKSDDYIVSHGLGDWYDYGDHAAGYAKNSPIAVSATSHWYYAALLTIKSARMLGDEQGVRKYEALAQKIRDAFNRKFFDPATKQYATGSQFCNAVSIYMGLVSPEDKQAVLDNLIADIKGRGYRLTTGDIGNRYLYQVLAENGRNDVMYAMHNHYDAPGYGFQIKYGLTTLTEQWDPRKGNSWNHFMMGQIEEWFFRSLAGIRPDKANPGFKNIVFAPQIIGDMTYAKASHESLYGTIRAEWKRNGTKVAYVVEVPVNSTGRVVVPDGATDIRVDGRKMKEREITIGSGRYVVEWTGGVLPSL